MLAFSFACFCNLAAITRLWWVAEREAAILTERPRPWQFEMLVRETSWAAVLSTIAAVSILACGFGIRSGSPKLRWLFLFVSAAVVASSFRIIYLYPGSLYRNSLCFIPVNEELALGPTAPIAASVSWVAIWVASRRWPWLRAA